MCSVYPVEMMSLPGGTPGEHLGVDEVGVDVGDVDARLAVIQQLLVQRLHHTRQRVPTTGCTSFILFFIQYILGIEQGGLGVKRDALFESSICILPKLNSVYDISIKLQLIHI